MQGSGERKDPSAVVFAAVAVIGLLALFALRSVSSHDLGFHLEAGNKMLDGGGWPRQDTFTYTLAHRPYIDTSWGYQVVVAAIERATGVRGIVLFHALLVVFVFSMLARTAWRGAPGSAWLAPLLLLGGLAAEPRFEARPELWSWALFALVLDRLHGYAERRCALWPIVPLFLVWANSHGLFIVGWGALACFATGIALRDGRFDRRLVGWSAAAVAATLVNPYGWRAVRFAWGLGSRLDRENAFAQTIGEFRSPLAVLTSDELQFYLPSITSWLLFAGVALVAVPGLRLRRHASSLLLLLLFLPLSLFMVRNVPLLVVVALPGVARALEILRPSSPGVGRPWVRLLPVAALGLASLLAARVVTDAFYVDARRPQRFGWGWNARVLPLDVAAWAASVRPPEPVLNDLAFGGYFIWARDEPVFIDGRLEVVGEEFFETYREAFASPAGLDAVVKRYGVGWIVFPYRLRPDTTAGLSSHPGWRLAYVDALAVAFVRHDVAAENLIHPSAAAALRPVAADLELSHLPGLGGVTRPSSFGWWIGGLIERRRYPDEAANLGLFHYSRNEPLKAARYFAAAIEDSGGAFPEIYGNLGLALGAAGRLEEARASLRVTLEGLPWYRAERLRTTRQHLARVEAALAVRQP